jgi:hypothetical protein
MIIPGNRATIGSQRFFWDKATRTFHADISDLGPDFYFGCVYDDAADVGLALRSRYDSRTIVFVVDRTERDREHEITGWHLSPVLPGDGGSVPFTIHIAND